MKVWTDKSGNRLTATEFAQRWKQGIQAVTPLQQLKASLTGYSIVFVGIVWGMVMSIIAHTWWLLVILIGSFVISGVQFLGMFQKYILLSKIQKEGLIEC